MIPVEGKLPNRFLLVDDDDAVLEVTNKSVGPILEGCNEQTMEALDEITLEAMYRENTLLYVEGQVTRGVFILCQGQVKLTRTSLEGKSFILKIAQPGHILGLNEVVGGYSHTSTAETLRSSQLAFIQSSKFLNFMKLHGDASLFVCRQLIADCASAYEVIRSIGLSECVKNKLARLLVGWSLDARCSEGFTRLRLKLTHEEISQMVGSCRETITRIFGELRKDNVVTQSGDMLTILDIVALKKLAGGNQLPWRGSPHASPAHLPGLP